MKNVFIKSFTYLELSFWLVVYSLSFLFHFWVKNNLLVLLDIIIKVFLTNFSLRLWHLLSLCLLLIVELHLLNHVSWTALTYQFSSDKKCSKRIKSGICVFRRFEWVFSRDSENNPTQMKSSSFKLQLWFLTLYCCRRFKSLKWRKGNV